MAAIDTDQPKNKLEEDRFQRYEFAKRIAKIIQNGNLFKSLVIGIYGKWGEGKTSVMNFIKAELPEDTVIVNFNPWLFSSEEQLIKSFFNSLAYELDQSLSTGKEKAGKMLSDYGEAIGTFTKFIGIPLEGLKQVGDQLQEVSIEKLKTRVDNIIQSTGKKIVICVDDIDRLDIREIQYIFKLIKLVGDFPGTTYILAFDDDMVANALAPQYGDKHINNGYNFLEKIIQLPLKIPKATQSALKKYTIETLDAVIKGLEIVISQDEVNKFRSAFDEYYLPQIDNPRLTTRYANAVYFALPLLYGEVSTPDLMLMEGMKILFPTAYDFTRHNSSLFLTDTSRESHHSPTKRKNQEDIIKETNNFLKSIGDHKAQAVKEIWKHLFPQYKYTTSNIAYRDDKWRDWYKQKRICSGLYFERYFTYVVQEGEISDISFQQFLSDLEISSIEDCEEKMFLFFKNNTVSDIIFKLRLWEDSLSVLQSKTLASLLARNGEKLPVEADEFASFTTNAEGAKTIAQLVINLPSEQRKDHLIDLFEQSYDLEFAMEIYYWFIYKNQKPKDKLMIEEEVKGIEYFLVTKFKEQINEKDFFDILPDAEMWRILQWWKEINAEEQQASIFKAVNNNIENAVKLIKIFTPSIMSYGNHKSETFKSDFNQKNYASMSSIIDCHFLYQILKANHKSKLKKYDLAAIPNRDRLSDQDLISIFMQFYELENSSEPMDIL